MLCADVYDIGGAVFVDFVGGESMDIFGVIVIIVCAVTLFYDCKIDKGVRKELVQENNNLRKLAKELNEQNKLERKQIELLSEHGDILRNLYNTEYKLRKMMEKSKEESIVEQLHNAGGCDGTTDYDKGWDDAIREAERIVKEAIKG